MTQASERFAAARRFSVALVVAAIALLAVAGTAGAHEHRHVADDQFHMTVGFLEEPALQNEPNGLSLRVTSAHEDDAGVEGLQETLQAEVIYGGQTMPLDLEPAFNDPGHYVAHFIPTATGAYTFRIFGTIEGNAVDESFTGGPTTFSEVASTESMMFPAPSPAEDPVALAADAQDSADGARTLAVVGIVVGLLGLVAGVLGAFLALRARMPAAGAPVRAKAD